MGMFERFMSAFNWLIVMLLGLTAIVWVGLPGSLIPDETMPMAAHKRAVVEFVTDPMGQTSLVIIGGLLIFLNWLFVVKLVRKSRYQRFIRFQNPSGDVIVQLGAVEECLTRAARETEQVHDVKVRVFAGTDKKPVTVVVSAAIWDAPNVPAVVESLQERLKGRFMEILNIEEPVDVEVTLRRLVTKGDSRKKKSVDSSGTPPTEPGFRGPEYPID
jgi:hypothetical protein